jgi:putative alpha-1,2-mannosidase
MNKARIVRYVNKVSVFVVFFSFFQFTPLHASKPEFVVDYVNTLIGTARKTEGGALPSVTVPFGRTHLVAMTNLNFVGQMPYHYEGKKIVGFMATHQPAPWMGDYGNFTIFPTLGESTPGDNNDFYKLDHQKEIAKPYYYSADLEHAHKQYAMNSEIAGVGDGGIFRFTFNKKGEQGLFIQASPKSVNDSLKSYLAQFGLTESSAKKTIGNGYIQIDIANNAVYGYNANRQDAGLGAPLDNFKGHFYLQFNKKIKSFGTWDYRYGKMPNRTTQLGINVGAYLVFEEDDQALEVRVATSFIDKMQVLANYNKKIENRSFESLVEQTKQAWEKELSRVSVDTKSENDKVIFYTAVYHTLLYPRIFSEDGRYYSAFDDQIHQGDSYTAFSTWDTFRAQHPWLILIAPERVGPMIQALLQNYKEGGWLPKWPNPGETAIMIGSHTDAIIADAYIKGIRNYDVNLAYEAVRKNAFSLPYGDTGGDDFYTDVTMYNVKKPELRAKDAGNYWWDRSTWNGCVESRGGLTYYLKYGFVPIDYTYESVSRTIEFGVDDYCIAQMAKELGKTEDFTELMKRAKYYKNLYNPQTGFFAPRYHDGRWFEKPNEGFTEGSPWTYRFGAMHDVNGMVELMGGTKSFTQRLDSNFVGKHYRHDNEPGHHYIYLYNWVGVYSKTQALARENFRKNYTADPAYGINGNDYCGQMSAWYLFTAMGFYPVAPASGEYVFGAPQFSNITVYLDSTKTKKLEIVAHGFSDKNLYVKKLTINGVLQKSPFLKHDQIKNGGRIEYWMDAKPSSTFKK